jgi:tRNA1Val (adenine37-N6)-methyltransferase
VEKRREDRLGLGNVRILQDNQIFKFTVDPIIAADFLRALPQEKVLDLGTGGGVIPLWVAGYREFGNVTGLELQPEVADMARESVALNGLQDKIQIITGDLRQPPESLGELGSFRWVISNPPYLPAQSKLTGNPALDRAKFELTCTLDDVAAAAKRLSTGNGRLVMVHLPERLPDLFETFRRHGFEPKLMRMVYSSPGKPPNRVLLEGCKTGQTHLKILPPLFIHEENGEFSAEMMAIYRGRMPDNPFVVS